MVGPDRLMWFNKTKTATTTTSVSMRPSIPLAVCWTLLGRKWGKTLEKAGSTKIIKASLVPIILSICHPTWQTHPEPLQLRRWNKKNTALFAVAVWTNGSAHGDLEDPISNRQNAAVEDSNNTEGTQWYLLGSPLLLGMNVAVWCLTGDRGLVNNRCRGMVNHVVFSVGRENARRLRAHLRLCGWWMVNHHIFNFFVTYRRWDQSTSYSVAPPERDSLIRWTKGWKENAAQKVLNTDTVLHITPIRFASCSGFSDSSTIIWRQHSKGTWVGPISSAVLKRSSMTTSTTLDTTMIPRRRWW